MPHLWPSLALGALGVAAILASGCTAPTGGATAALSLDGGAVMELPAPVDAPPCGLPDRELSCTVSYPPFLCGGHCGGAELCCVTGVRPMGICRTLDGCAEQCAWDCGTVGQTQGPRAQLICEAFCIAVAPDVVCE